MPRAIVARMCCCRRLPREMLAAVEGTRECFPKPEYTATGDVGRRYAAKGHHTTIIRAEVPGPPYVPWYRGASISILFHFYVLIRASISKAPRGVSGVLLFELPSSRSYGAASLEQLLLLELLELPSSVRHTRTALTCT